jgi:hypothetical protein
MRDAIRNQLKNSVETLESKIKSDRFKQALSVHLKK